MAASVFFKDFFKSNKLSQYNEVFAYQYLF